MGNNTGCETEEGKGNKNLNEAYVFVLSESIIIILCYNIQFFSSNVFIMILIFLKI